MRFVLVGEAEVIVDTVVLVELLAEKLLSGTISTFMDLLSKAVARVLLVIMELV